MKHLLIKIDVAVVGVNVPSHTTLQLRLMGLLQNDYDLGVEDFSITESDEAEAASFSGTLDVIGPDGERIDIRTVAHLEGMTEEQKAYAASDLWEKDSIQFPRLLAEINALGLTDSQFGDLMTSMDIDNESDLHDLFHRAEKQWERIKTRITGVDTTEDDDEVPDLALVIEENGEHVVKIPGGATIIFHDENAALEAARTINKERLERG